MSYFKELQELEDQGIDLIEVLGQDRYLESPEALSKIIEQLARSGDNLYTELLYYLTHRRFASDQAESMWRAIMKHKARMSEALGRRVAFRVAALDYLTHRTPVLRNVRLIAKPEFEGILSYVNIDEVTGVYNRRYFNDILAQEIHRARRYEGELSLLILDLDDFKRINDTLGHPEGDAVLRRVGRLLRDSTRQPDTVCRYGGDEFAVILPETSGPKARAMAERIRVSTSRLNLALRAADRPQWPALVRDRARREEAPAQEPATITCSVGAATYPSDCDEADELVALADQLCLDAKRDGKNRVLMPESPGDLHLAAE